MKLMNRVRTVLFTALFAAVTLLVSSTPAQAATLPATGYGQLIARHSTKCLDDPNYSTGNNVQIDQYSCVGQTNEGWRVEEPVSFNGSTHYVWIRNQYSGKCLTVLGGSTASGASVVQYTCSTANGNGLWWIECWDFSYGRSYDFVNKNSDLVLNIKGASKANNAPLVQWPWRADALNQYFAFAYDLNQFAKPYDGC